MKRGRGLRLDKYLADCGVGTRSEVKKMIRSGEVLVEGILNPAPDTKIDENSARVFIGGKLIKYRKYIYIMMNKPSGYVSATWDKHKKVVIDLLPEEYRHFEVFPVGRLDIDTVGLLVLTNDGELSHKLLSPNKHIPKTYYAEVDKKLEKSDVDAFSKGMDLGDFVAKPALLNIIDDFSAEVTIAEGKFHQVKRMFEKTGKTVTYLKRIKMNRLMLDENLAEGCVRELTQEELDLLKYGIDKEQE